MNALRYPLFELSPSELEELSLDLLQAEGGAFEPAREAAFDIEGRRTANGRDEHIAVEVKHRTHFYIGQLKDFIAKVGGKASRFNMLIYITSAPISIRQRELIESTVGNSTTQNVAVIGQHELHSLLSKHPVIGEKYFKTAVAKKKRRTLIAAGSAVIVAFSSLSLISTAWKEVVNPQPFTFEDRINAVEQNLQSLRSLEESLQDLKLELQEKSAETARIQLEYEEALKLKSFTDEEINRFKKAASTTNAMETFLNYLYGFIIGVFGSILATIVTDRWKAMRALNRS
ncbi:hypothetical protein [Pseudomonas fulva]|uniref:hypothetical protein n=1 Tax=Pseudomonas fulva TaxID=47880 RepID=UPI0018AB7FB3|nr:hypothetical protein [Pseudomonas fulva]MBF8774090.1 hypothetical protein [Pseudomonas fulva]